MLKHTEEFIIKFQGSGTMVCSHCSNVNKNIAKVKRFSYAESSKGQALIISECHGHIEIKPIQDHAHFTRIGAAFKKVKK